MKQLGREILALRRFKDGKFGIYEDGKLAETIEASPDTYHIMLPLRMWRHFNEIVKRRIEQRESNKDALQTK